MAQTFFGDSLAGLQRLMDFKTYELRLVSLSIQEGTLVVDSVIPIAMGITDVSGSYTFESDADFRRIASGQNLRNIYMADLNVLPDNLADGSHYLVSGRLVFLPTRALRVAQGIVGYRVISLTDSIIDRRGLAGIRSIDRVFISSGRTKGRLDTFFDDLCEEIPEIIRCVNLFLSLDPRELELLLSETGILLSSTEVSLSQVRRGDN